MDVTAIGAIGAAIGLVLGKTFDFILTWYKGKKDAELTEQQTLLKGYKELLDDLRKSSVQITIDNKNLLAQFLQERVENASLRIANIELNSDMYKLQEKLRVQ